MRLGTRLLYEGSTLQGAHPKLVGFCSALMAGFCSAVDMVMVNQRVDDTVGVQRNVVGPVLIAPLQIEFFTVPIETFFMESETNLGRADRGSTVKKLKRRTSSRLAGGLACGIMRENDVNGFPIVISDELPRQVRISLEDSVSQGPVFAQIVSCAL